MRKICVFLNLDLNTYTTSVFSFLFIAWVARAIKIKIIQKLIGSQDNHFQRLCHEIGTQIGMNLRIMQILEEIK